MSKVIRQIIAIGGGGFSKCYNFSSDNMTIEKYILEQTGKECPSICFIPTASADSAQYIVDYYSGVFSNYIVSLPIFHYLNHQLMILKDIF